MDLRPIGLSHPRIRQVESIQKNSAPNPRRLLIAEGLWAHNLLLKYDIPIECFFWCPEAAYASETQLRAEQIAAVAESSYQISAKTMLRISERDKPDGLLSLAELPQWAPGDLSFHRSALVMVADGMEIPGNLGTLIRTADACRVDCLVLTNRRTRLTHPKLFRASQGTVLTVPVVEFAEVADARSWLLSHNFDLLLAATEGAQNYRSVEYRNRRIAFVLGA